MVQVCFVFSVIRVLVFHEWYSLEWRLLLNLSVKEKSFWSWHFSFSLFVIFHQQYAWLVGSQYKPMELVKSDWAVIRKSPPWSIDSWGLGKCLIARFVM